MIRKLVLAAIAAGTFALAAPPVEARGRHHRSHGHGGISISIGGHIPHGSFRYRNRYRDPYYDYGYRYGGYYGDRYYDDDRRHHRRHHRRHRHHHHRRYY